MADTLDALRRDLHALDLKVEAGQVRSEERHSAILSAIAELRKDMSEQGKTPRPVEPRTGVARLLPDSWTPVAVAQASLIMGPLLLGIWGVSYTGAQSGGASAVEDAAEEGRAVQIAAPPRPLPVPIPIPIPVPVPIEQPAAAPPPNDLLPLPGDDR